MTARTYTAAEMREAFKRGWRNGDGFDDRISQSEADAEALRLWPDPAPAPPAMTAREEGEAAGARPGGHPMTEPYTAEEMPKVVNALELKAEGTYAPVNYDRLIATLREYERVLAENASLRRYLDQRASGTDPLTKRLEAEVAALREEEAKWAATVERQRKNLDRYREQRAALEADKDHLARLAGKLLEQLGDGGVPDGGEMQELLVEAGVIAPVEVTESCGENCNCAEWDFPTTCYRKTPLGDYCVARAAGEG